MSRRKAAKNEIRDYAQDSAYGLAALWCGAYLINNYTDAEVPYFAAPAISFGLSALRRWYPATRTMSAVNSASNSVMVNGESMMLSAVKWRVGGREEEAKPAKPTFFDVPYRAQIKSVRLSDSQVIEYLKLGYGRQMGNGNSPYSAKHYQGWRDKTIYCLWRF